MNLRRKIFGVTPFRYLLIRHQTIVFCILLFFSFTAVFAVSPRWKKQPVKLTLSSSLTELASEKEILEIVKRSAGKWEAVANVRFDYAVSNKTSASINAPDGVNLITIAATPENIAFLGERLIETPAKTKIFYSKDRILEADIVLNPYIKFSTDGKFDTFDLEAVLTHEIGHLLGLEHSAIYGSVMNPNFAKNGTYGIPQTFFRNLSQSDISQIRSLYGAGDDAEDCCAVLKGRISVVGESFPLQIWLEDAESGRVQAATLSSASGRFFIGGISAGRYRIFAQGAKRNKQVSEEIGFVSVEAGEILRIEKTLKPLPNSFEVEYIGFNGQISKIPVTIGRGGAYLIYLAGKNLSPETIKVEATSSYLIPLSETVSTQNFGEEITALSLAIEVSLEIPEGEYTLVLEGEKGERVFLIGALVVTREASVRRNFFVF